MIGEHRSNFVPNSEARSGLELSMLSFVGALAGICCLDNNRALPLSLASIVWKSMVSESLTLTDLKQIDYHSWNLIQLMKRQQPSAHTAAAAGAAGAGAGSLSSGPQVNEQTFEYLFPDLTFSVEIEVEGPSGGGGGGAAASSQRASKRLIIDLLPNGRHIPVTYCSSPRYALLLEKFHLGRYSLQINNMCKGLASIVPFDFLSSQCAQPHTEQCNAEPAFT